MSKTKSSKTAVDSIQAIIEVYKKDVDRTFIQENLKFTVEQRLIYLHKFRQFAFEMRESSKRAHESGADRKSL